MQVIVDIVKKDGTAIKATDGKWYQASRFCKPPISFTENKPGDVLELEANDKGFVTAIKGPTQRGNVPPKAEDKPKEPPKKEDPAPVLLTSTQRDTRILYQGLYQAAIQSPGLLQHTTGELEDYFKLMHRAVDEMAKAILAMSA